MKLAAVHVSLAVLVVGLCGTIVCDAKGYGWAFSIQMRCFSSLSLAGFLGKAGRSMLKAIVLSCIVTGPIHNLSLNAQEVVRVFTCSTVLTYNLSMVQSSLMTKPFHNALLGSKENLGRMKDEFRTMVDIIEPIKQEVERRNETYSSNSRERRADVKPTSKDYQDNYKLKLKKRCITQLSRGIKHCEDIFLDNHEMCRKTLPVVLNSMLCWPLRIDFMCSGSSLFADAEKLCSTDKVTGPDFGEDYEHLKHAEQVLVGDLDGIEINYEFVDMEHHSGYLTAKQTSKEVIRKFEEKKSSIDLIAFLLQRLFAFVFLRVILDAMSYHQNYLIKMDFRNHYITQYFRHVDNRRKFSGKLKLLPLRRVELPHYVDLESRSCNRLEVKNVIGHSSILILQVITISVFILLDYFLCETLDIVARHSGTQYEQQGYHDINITVTGSGVIATIVRRSVERFDIQERLQLLTSNEECLPKPSRLRIWNVIQIYLLMLGIAILMLGQPYIERMRRFICAWFYPKREKQRILHLYNRLLKRRKQIFKQLLEQLKQNIRKRRYSSRMNFLDRMQFYYPGCCRWVKFIRKKSCSVCNVKGPNLLIECNNFNCFLIYCDECWQELNETCAACDERDHLEHDCALY